MTNYERLLWRQWTTQRRLGASAALSFAIAIACIPLVALRPSGIEKLALIGVGLAATESARRAFYGHAEHRDTDADIFYAERRQLIENHKDFIRPPLTPVAAPVLPLEPSQDDLITDVVEYWLKQEKHLLIIGGTGAGKTTFIKAFANRLYDWRVRAYDIDATKDDWTWCSQVEHTFEGVFGAMQEDLAQIPDVRKQRHEVGNGWTPAQPTLTIADEFPALVAEDKELPKRWLGTHAKQTRKHKLMIAVLAQNDTVSNLGLRGDSSVRDTCFTRVYLGEKAYEQAQKLKNPELKQWLVAGGYNVCLVDDKPALRPQ